jgi:hypothetical protein
MNKIKEKKRNEILKCNNEIVISDVGYGRVEIKKEKVK